MVSTKVSAVMGATPVLRQRPLSFASRMVTVTQHNEPRVDPYRLLTVLVLLSALMALQWMFSPPTRWSWPKPPEEPVSLLGDLLTAQAAIAALTLAVALFTLEAVRARPDTDDRMFRVYRRRSWVRPIFHMSLVAIAVTGFGLLVGSFTSEVGGLVVGALAFLGSLVLAVILFERALHLAHPSEMSNLRLSADRDAIMGAVRRYLNE